MRRAANRLRSLSLVLLLGCTLNVRAVQTDGGSDDPIGPVLGTGAHHLTPSVKIPMRDGIKLATDIYLPDGPGPFPIILIRTPYDKNLYRPPIAKVAPMDRADTRAAEFYVSHGYAVVVQDFRGRWESEGLFRSGRNQRTDFVDTVQWLDGQSWSAHRMGMFGCSYVGESQVVAAAADAPSLKAITPMAQAGGFSSGVGRYSNVYSYTGGVREFSGSIAWFAAGGSDLYLKPDPSVPPEIWARYAHLFSAAPQLPDGLSIEAHLNDLPILGITDRLGLPPNDWNNIADHDAGSTYWLDGGELIRAGEKLHAPALWINTWNDAHPGETIDAFHYAQSHAADRTTAANQHLIMGPGGHCALLALPGHAKIGDLEIPDGRIDLWAIQLRWNDYWLKGDRNALRNLPRVQYFLMGKNEWRTATDLPLPGSREKILFLSSGHGANTRNGDGELTTSKPQRAGRDSYEYDPFDPVRGESFSISNSPLDRRSQESRQDVLVYKTAPLSRGLTAVGPVKLKLFVSSSARDTDFAARILDLYPDGRAISLQQGIIRARYRRGIEAPMLMKADEIVPLTIDLEVIANWFAPGHRIGIEITSSDFPRYERNLNTGGNNFDESNGVTAQNHIHFGGNTLSQLVLLTPPDADQ